MTGWDEPVELVTTSRPPAGFHGQGTPPVLHTADCRYARKTDPTHVFPEGTWTLRDAYGAGDCTPLTGYDRACRVCLPNYENGP